MATLAINGGNPVRTTPFPAYNNIDDREINAVTQVLKSGKLSSYLGTWHPHFYGGPQVQKFEKEWAEYFGVKHAISVNSNTSGLMCAIGAAGIGPGDEVIVSPYTMSASATSIMVFNGVPVFADIEPNYFCLDPKSVEEKITERTKAIMVVDIFGLPYDVEAIHAIAKKHNLIIIEDTAQAPGAKYKDQFAGTLSDMGIFSLNYHKHIHSGEGGVIVTNNDDLAERCQLIRNHAESVVEGKGVSNVKNMIGFNFRMTEIEAAIAGEQLKKLESVVNPRVKNCEYLAQKLSELPMINQPGVRPNSTHVYYQLPFLYDASKADGIHRNDFIKAVKAELPYTELRKDEGALIGAGYVRPLYLQSIYHQEDESFTYNFPQYKGSVKYDKGICPVVEDLHYNTLFTTELIHPPLSNNDLDDVVKAFYKVAENLEELKIESNESITSHS